MGTPPVDHRHCPECKLWKHHSKFRYKERRVVAGHSTVTRFNRWCRDCEQKNRNEKKNADRPLAIIRSRAAVKASSYGVSLDFMWTQMNYRAFVPAYRAALSEDGMCLSCGHKPDNERDVQLDHIEPPRKMPDGMPDFARLHARNMRLICGSCNRAKGDKPFADWLDEQESARLSNLAAPVPPVTLPKHEDDSESDKQATLF